MSEYYQRTNLALDYRQEAKKICDVHVNKLALIYLVYFSQKGVKVLLIWGKWCYNTLVI